MNQPEQSLQSPARRIQQSVKVFAYLMMLLAFLFSPLAYAEDANPAPIRIRFNYNDGQWLAPRNEFSCPGLDLVADQDKQGRLLTIRIDLNGDGVPEYFLRTLCGNGGCEYPVFDGRTSAYLGTIFGSEIWLLHRLSHGLPIIESFSHLAAFVGTVGRYEFNGERYKEVSSRQIGDEETQLLYKRLDAAPRIKAH
jgi:hypothetical protein